MKNAGFSVPLPMEAIAARLRTLHIRNRIIAFYGEKIKIRYTYRAVYVIMSLYSNCYIILFSGGKLWQWKSVAGLS